jgi:phage terminase large subunit
MAAGSKVSLPNNWRARHYQKDLMQYLFGNGTFPERKRAFAVWHRRAGKDSTMLNTLAVSSQMRVGTYWHLLPTLNQSRKVVWNGIDSQGRRMIYQAFPPEMVESSNESEMTLKLKNGSVYQCVGSDNYDALVGSNPLGVVLSEWALSEQDAWNFIRPILAENGGFAAFITTPRGKNHAYDLWKTAQASKDWFASRMTVNDTYREDGTPVISKDIIEMERAEGVAEEIIQQEYFCSWEGILYGSIYGKILAKYEATNQLTFQYDPDQLVFTAWDLGRRDATAIWFYQIVGGEVHVIDFLSGTGGDVDSWLEEMSKLPYAYGTPALPHDANAKTFATKHTVFERFIAEGYKPYLVKNIRRSQGIQAVRSILPHVYFNVGNPRVADGLAHLAAYHYEYDQKTKSFSTEPAHDEHSHPADAFRMLALSSNVMDMSTNNRRSISPRTYKTPVGNAYKLEELFQQREASMSATQRI